MKNEKSQPLVNEFTEVEQQEIKLIKQMLKEFKGKRKETAQQLNVSERTLYRKITQYGIGNDYGLNND